MEFDVYEELPPRQVVNAPVVMDVAIEWVEVAMENPGMWVACPIEKVGIKGRVKGDVSDTQWMYKARNLAQKINKHHAPFDDERLEAATRGHEVLLRFMEEDE
ncbi:hypothetical protein [Corynebacterium vitaeruminis]|uniref:hypothetical protein n=1 Tax=Corynebacterium vitaeruminis TaxID=38305 RepID=UPI0023F2BCB0|nr:hypothetical protein [Corynebacterium vitaeruminis]